MIASHYYVVAELMLSDHGTTPKRPIKPPLDPNNHPHFYPTPNTNPPRETLTYLRRHRTYDSRSDCTRWETTICTG